jgi:hypothetical protein
MGCHTHFSVPLIKGKEEILKQAQAYVNKFEKSLSYKQLYQYAIDNELHDPVCDLVDGIHSSNWVIYQTIGDWAVKQYNQFNGTNYKMYYDAPTKVRDSLEKYPDSPRIGGYPETIIRSYDEMVKAIETGLEGEYYNCEKDNFDKRIYYFHFDTPDGIEEVEFKNKIMQGIKTFFELHPDGIITFG